MISKNKAYSNNRSYSDKPYDQVSLYMDDRSDRTDKKTELVANMIK